MENKYDKDNIFSKMLRGEIPCDKIYEDDLCIAFNDIAPAAPIHVLVIPKAEFCSFNDFAQNAEPEMISGFFKSVQKVADKLGLEEDGYRVIHNHGFNASQTVFHFHVHILGGRPLGALVPGDRLER